MVKISAQKPFSQRLLREMAFVSELMRVVGRGRPILQEADSVPATFGTSFRPRRASLGAVFVGTEKQYSF